MNPLVIKLSGEIENSNFDEWKTDLVAQIRAVNTELTTDNQFADATKNVKTFKAAEKSLKQAKQSAIEQAAEINKLFDAIDTVAEETRQVRLSLEKQIKKRKAEIKQDHINIGVDTVKKFIAAQSGDFKLIAHDRFLDEDIFEDAVKGRTSAATMQVAIDKLCVQIQEAISTRAIEVTINGKILDGLPVAQQSLFQDRGALLEVSTDELNKEVDKRVLHWEESQTREITAPEVPGLPTNAEQESDNEVDAPAENQKQTFHLIIELVATVAAADTLKSEVEKVWGGESSVKKIELVLQN